MLLARDSIVGISIPSSISLPASLFTRSIKSLTENNACKSVKKELEELERRNVTYIDSDGLTVKFYTIYDHYYIYRSPISSSGGEDNLGDGWSYVKTSKS